jgi:hypothetical protein
MVERRTQVRANLLREEEDLGLCTRGLPTDIRILACTVNHSEHAETMVCAFFISQTPYLVCLDSTAFLAP